MIRLIVLLLTLKGLKGITLSEFVTTRVDFTELKRSVLSLNREQRIQLNEAIEQSLEESPTDTGHDDNVVHLDAETIAKLRSSVAGRISKPSLDVDLDEMVGIAKVDPAVWENKSDRELITDYLVEKHLHDRSD